MTDVTIGGQPPRESQDRGRLPLWATLATFGLFAIGFRPGRYATPEVRRHHDSYLESDHADRGRFADTPMEIRLRGWKDILLRVWTGLSEDRVIAVAAGIAFYSLLAIFPAIAALVALYGFFADPATIGNHLDNVANFVPGGGLDVIREQLRHVSSQAGGTLGLTFLVGLATSLWSANAGTKALFDALNVVYGEKESRGFFQLTAVTLLFTLGGIMFLLLSMAALVVLPVALSYLGLSQDTEFLARFIRWPALFLLITFAIAFIYRYGPSRQRPRWRWVTVGSVFATMGWLLVSILFSWYAANFGSYNKTYGSLGAVIGFMTWMWLSAVVVLVGAELDAEIEHQTMRDTTTGRPKPMGSRGAHMADTVGAAQD